MLLFLILILFLPLEYALMIYTSSFLLLPVLLFLVSGLMHGSVIAGVERPRSYPLTAREVLPGEGLCGSGNTFYNWLPRGSNVKFTPLLKHQNI